MSAYRNGILAVLFILLGSLGATANQGRIESHTIHSLNFTQNKIGVAPDRRVKIYLPPGYDATGRRLPVIYFLNGLDETESEPFASHGAAELLDSAIARGTIGEVIMVTADFTTPLGMSWYVNSPVTGNWEDFMVQELVAYVDRHYRTITKAGARGLAGDRMGGYGAIRFGMKYPDVFGTIYALHPVGTGPGVQAMQTRPNWDSLHAARTIEAVKSNVFNRIFTTIFQAFLPNPARPPLFADLPVRKIDGKLAVDTALAARLSESFELTALLPRYAPNLSRLRGFMFDWGRNDTIYDHIYANRTFAYALEQYGIAYEAEEYRGGWGDRIWGQDGRVNTAMLPFFARHLIFFEPPAAR